VRDALIRAVLIAPLFLIYWAFIEWRSGNRIFCAIGLHRWGRVWSDPGYVLIGKYCRTCKRAEGSLDAP